MSDAVSTTRSPAEQKILATKHRLDQGVRVMTELGLLLTALEAIGVAEDDRARLGQQVTDWANAYLRNGHAGMADG